METQIPSNNTEKITTLREKINTKQQIIKGKEAALLLKKEELINQRQKFKTLEIIETIDSSRLQQLFQDGFLFDQENQDKYFPYLLD